MKIKISLKIFLLSSFLSTFFDQITKFFIVNFLEKYDGNLNITSFFSLSLVKNKGIIFGFFSYEKAKIFIIFFSITAIFFILWILFLGKTEKYYQFSLGLIVGGIIGNLIDRIKNGYVIDFLNFHFWPVFNFADSFILIGIILFFIRYSRG
ncbi:MAG: signal peptidase II [bacterium]|nr:signal peptidase II [bacterium]MCX7917609.1 signal peptidase II [bacterium]MDW8163878.1 signal peptidase II [Candidatus Omnitrophota bacterium]